MNVGNDAALRDRDTGEKLIEFCVVFDGKCDVARSDANLLVVSCSVASQLQDLSDEVVQHSSCVDGSS